MSVSMSVNRGQFQEDSWSDSGLAEMPDFSMASTSTPKNSTFSDDSCFSRTLSVFSSQSPDYTIEASRCQELIDLCKTSPVKSNASVQSEYVCAFSGSHDDIGARHLSPQSAKTRTRTTDILPESEDIYVEMSFRASADFKPVRRAHTFPSAMKKPRVNRARYNIDKLPEHAYSNNFRPAKDLFSLTPILSADSSPRQKNTSLTSRLKRSLTSMKSHVWNDGRRVLKNARNLARSFCSHGTSPKRVTDDDSGISENSCLMSTDHNGDHYFYFDLSSKNMNLTC